MLATLHVLPIINQVGREKMSLIGSTHQNSIATEAHSSAISHRSKNQREFF